MITTSLDYRRVRAKIIHAMREFFAARDFVETDTPSLVLSPGMEPHIRPVEVRARGADRPVFLPTSPEFAMKRLLADGYERIFQICKAYRDEPPSSTHNPEFTMLEWYRANAGYEAIMDDVEALFAFVAGRVSEVGHLRERLSRPWRRISVEQCFREFAGLELAGLASLESMREACARAGWAAGGAAGLEWDDCFFLVMMNAVEPALAKLGEPVIVYLYPERQAALANLVTDSRGLRWAKRFEVYAGGFELGNAFDELADPTEQRRRFEKDMATRARIYGDGFPANPIDEKFLEALRRLPPSGGIAMGVDRIVMYFTGAKSIEEVLWQPSHWPVS